MGAGGDENYIYVALSYTSDTIYLYGWFCAYLSHDHRQMSVRTCLTIDNNFFLLVIDSCIQLLKYTYVHGDFLNHYSLFVL